MAHLVAGETFQALPQLPSFQDFLQIAGEDLSDYGGGAEVGVALGHRTVVFTGPALITLLQFRHPERPPYLFLLFQTPPPLLQEGGNIHPCLLYTPPRPRDGLLS